ncbi:MAG: glutamate racemase, partial [Aphanizomenon sp.]
PEFVPLIEQNRIHDPYTTEIAKTYLEPLIEKEIDTLVYGCTHYPLMSPVLRSLLPPQVKLIDPAVHVVATCSQELDILGAKNIHPPMPTRFAVSGCPRQFSQSGLQWLGYTPMVEQVCFAEAVLS